MNKLSNRLKTIASFVKYGESVADIGSDHGLLIKYLYDKGVIEKGYLSDNKVGPYNRLKKIQSQLNSYFVIALKDGIEDLPSWIDCIVIAGMGEKTIKHILEGKNLLNIKSLIIEGRGEIDEIRRFMNKINYKIVDETIVFEEHYYEIIRFEKGQENLTEEQLHFGPINLLKRDINLINKWKCEQDKLFDVLKKNIDEKRREEINKQIERINYLWMR